mmetsp:Transcript_7012/g.9932  ORF Transcript_7012/g.9932 Transcript_7012/m.9932 type:complete len:312 (+) Transcript_7012:134-1069(+)
MVSRQRLVYYVPLLIFCALDSNLVASRSAHRPRSCFKIDPIHSPSPYLNNGLQTSTSQPLKFRRTVLAARTTTTMSRLGLSPYLSPVRRRSYNNRLHARKPGESPVAGGMINPAYWKLEYLKAEMFKQIPPKLKVLLVGSGTARDAFYFPKEVEVTLEGLTVGLQDVITAGGSALPKLQVTNSIKALPAGSFDAVVTVGEFSRVTENGKVNPDKFFRDVTRVLRPNGRVVFLEPSEAKFPLQFEKYVPESSINSDSEALLGPFGSTFDYGEAVLLESASSANSDGKAGFSSSSTTLGYSGSKRSGKKRRMG